MSKKSITIPTGEEKNSIDEKKSEGDKILYERTNLNLFNESSNELLSFEGETPTSSNFGRLSQERSQESLKGQKKILEKFGDLSEPIESEEVIHKISYTKEEIQKEKDENDIEIVPLKGSIPERRLETITTEIVTDESSLAEESINEGSEIVHFVSDEESELASDTSQQEYVFETISKDKFKIYFEKNTQIIQVKRKIGSIFNIEPELVQLSWQGVECDDQLCLSEFERTSLPFTTFYIHSALPTEYFSPGQFHRYEHFRNYITVKTHIGEGRFVTTRVVIENQNYFKEWHGGYRNTKTNVEYHNKLVQTNPRIRPPFPKIYSRETQTPAFPMKDFTTNTTVNKGTQMWRNDLFVPTMKDRIIIGNSENFQSKKPMVPFPEFAKSLATLRKFFKNLVQKNRQKLEEEYVQKCLQNEQRAKEFIQEALIVANSRDIIGTSLPINRGDFYMLYLLVGKWWRNEMSKITKMKSNEARKAAIFTLLENELDFLLIIEKKRVEAKYETMKKKEIEFLETTGRPIIFRDKKRQMSSIDNTGTQQSRELQEIMSSFLKNDVTPETRINTLQNLKVLIINLVDYDISKELLDLIDRECDLLRIGTPDNVLKILRERILIILQDYLHSYEINPRAKSYNLPNYAKTVQSLFQCNYCTRLKAANEFNVHVRMTRFEMCHSCEWMNNMAVKRMDLSPYSRLLQQVRETEMKKCCRSSNCFVLQPVGMAYLVQKIWDNQSAISECSRIDELRMVRFRKDEDWSPWNCILLTLEESAAHDQIPNVDEFYHEWFLNRIHLKNLKAKAVFFPLILNEKEMCDNGLWFNVTDSGKFLHPSNITNFATSKDFRFF